MAGENALPCFSPGHVDSVALERIVYNTQAWAPPLQVPVPLSVWLQQRMHHHVGIVAMTGQEVRPSAMLHKEHPSWVVL